MTTDGTFRSYPHPTSSQVSAAMRGNRRADTSPERRLRSELHRRGLRFRKDFSIDIGSRRKPRADIVFPRRRVAVFVDGCFWHLCPKHGRIPGGANHEYWAVKLTRNQHRDLEDTNLLISAGWTVIRIWEHQDPAEAADNIESTLRER